MTLLLSRRDTAGLVDLAATVEALTAAFAAHGRGDTLSPSRVHVAADGGGFHVVVGGLATGDPPAFTTKINASFEPGPGQGGVRLVGLVVLSDAATGAPLAVLDSGPLTTIRTAAVTTVALRTLAAPGVSELLVVGAGRQAADQLAAARLACPGLERARVWGAGRERREALATRWREEHPDLEVVAVDDLAAAVRTADAIVTVTPSRAPLVAAADERPGTTIVALGADAPGKQELEARLTATARVVCDVVAQCVAGGELGRAIEAGLVDTTHAVAELGQVVAGIRPGRTRADEVVVFDSTGTAMQDAAAAITLWRAAQARGLGTSFDFSA